MKSPRCHANDGERLALEMNRFTDDLWSPTKCRRQNLWLKHRRPDVVKGRALFFRQKATPKASISARNTRKVVGGNDLRADETVTGGDPEIVASARRFTDRDGDFIQQGNAFQ